MSKEIFIHEFIQTEKKSYKRILLKSFKALIAPLSTTIIIKEECNLFNYGILLCYGIIASAILKNFKTIISRK